MGTCLCIFFALCSLYMQANKVIMRQIIEDFFFTQWIVNWLPPVVPGKVKFTVACHQLPPQLALFIWKYLWQKVNVLGTNDRSDVNALQNHEPCVGFSHSISQSAPCIISPPFERRINACIIKFLSTALISVSPWQKRGS